MTTLRRPILEIVSILSIAVAMLASSAWAQQDAATPSPIPKGARLAEVTSDNVYIRSGGADSYYPFGKLRKGDLVVVIDEKYDWARVLTRGPSFAGYFAYVSTPHSGTPGYRVDDSGRTMQTLGRIDLLAPNLNTAFEPKDSWKRILDMGPDRKLEVLETVTTDRAIIQKVAMPDDAEGWISRSLLAPATEEQVAFWTTLTLAKGAVKAGGSSPLPAPKAMDAADRDTTSVLATPETAVPPVETPADTTAAMPPATFDVPTGTSGAEPPATYDVPAGTLGPEANDAHDAEAAAGDTGRPDAETTPAAIDARPATPTVGAAPPTADPATESDSPTATASMPPATETAVLPRIEGPLTARQAQKTFEDLEEAYLRLRDEPIRTAEVGPLRLLYLQLADASTNSTVVERYATARAEQLALWGDLQKRREELDRLRQRIDVSAVEAEAMRIAMDARGLYAAAGRLEASTIFSGGAMPLLYRVQDTTTGRTLAYLRPNDGFELGPLLGQLVGIVGDTTRDEALQLNLLQPRRIDLLVSEN